MSQIGKLVEVVQVTLNEAGRAGSMRPNTVHPDHPAVQHTPDAPEPVRREERDVFHTAHGA